MAPTRPARLVGGVILTLAASGCGSAPPPSTPPGPAPALSTAPDPAPPGEITLDGVAHRGALPSCVTFAAADGRRFVLLDGDVPTDVPVTVRGTPDPGSASYCNAGTPLHVSSAVPR